MSISVSLWSGNIPYLGLIASHFWFEVSENNCIGRWEVWQQKNCCLESWGYLHKNLLPAKTWLKNVKFRKEFTWLGEDATRIARQLNTSNVEYPFQQQYRAWPGPNSNTFVQFIIDQAKVTYQLPNKAVGKNYRWKLDADYYK